MKDVQQWPKKALTLTKERTRDLRLGIQYAIRTANPFPDFN